MGQVISKVGQVLTDQGYSLKDAEQEIELMKIQIGQLKSENKSNIETLKVLRSIILQLGMSEEQLLEIFPKVWAEIFGA